MKCKCKFDVPEGYNYCPRCGRPLFKFYSRLHEIRVPEPIQLDSGNWRIQLRKEKVSITESTPEACREKAREAKLKWIADEAAGLHAPPPERLLLGDAIDIYLASNTNSLSASTMRSYKSYREHRFQSCMDWDMKDESLNWQMAVNAELASVKPKTVYNAWHLITAVFSFNGLPIPKVKIPRSAKKPRPFLTHNQIDQFITAVKGTEVELPVLLGLSSLRLSEIIALKPTDISPDGKTFSVHASRVLNSDNEYELREINKSKTSTRLVKVAIPRLQELLAEAAKSDREYICDWTEKRLYDHINRVCRKAGLPEIGVHGLRHTFASLAYHLDWKKKSTMEIGGWSNSQIVDSVYTHNTDLDDDVKRMEEYYKSLLS